MIRLFPAIAIIFITISVIWVISSKIMINKEEPTSNSILSGEMKRFEFDKKDVSKDLSFYDENNKQVNLKSYKEKVILLNLWAVWCPPCVVEMPQLDLLHKKISNIDFEVIAVSLGKEGLKDIESFYKKNNIKNLKIFYDKDKNFYNNLSFDGLPTSILIDKKGMEIGRVNGEVNWSSDEAVSLIKTYLE